MNMWNQSMRVQFCYQRWAKYFVALIVLGWFYAFAQPAYAATAEQQARRDKCPDGRYSGPGTGTKRFHPDPYLWFASREFVQRFCMPESYIDDSLQGALAIAVRIKPSDEVICGQYMGRSDVCNPAGQELLLEVYLDNQKVQIPKATPGAQFYSRRVWNSAQYMSIGSARADRRTKGERPEVPGEEPVFQPADKVPTWTQFQYVGVHRNWAHIESHFTEIYYRENLFPGVDYIGFELFPGFGGLTNPDTGMNRRMQEPNTADPILGYAMAVIKERDLPRGSSLNDQKKIAFPSGYIHTISLPFRLAQLIYAQDQKADGAMFKDIQRSMQPQSVAPQPSSQPQ